MADDPNEDAFAYLQGLLRSYGLEELSPWAFEQLKQGSSPTVVVQGLYEQPQFQQRFKAIFDRRAMGLPPISVNEVLDYERQVRSLFKANGMPVGFYDSPDDYTKFLVNDTSVAELADRIEQYKSVVYDLDPSIRGDLEQTYGITAGGLLAYVIDPDRALPLVTKEARDRAAIARRVDAARLVTAAREVGFGPLSSEEALSFAGRGITAEQLRSSLGALQGAKGLFDLLPGETGEVIDRATQLAAATGDVEAIRKIQRKAEQRAASFAGGGAFASSQRGLSGLGTAST